MLGECFSFLVSDAAGFGLERAETDNYIRLRLVASAVPNSNRFRVDGLSLMFRVATRFNEKSLKTQTKPVCRRRRLCDLRLKGRRKCQRHRSDKKIRQANTALPKAHAGYKHQQ